LKKDSIKTLKFGLIAFVTMFLTCKSNVDYDFVYRLSVLSANKAEYEYSGICEIFNVNCPKEPKNIVVHYEQILNSLLFERYKNRISKSKEFSLEFRFDEYGRIINMGPYKP
jgi:hypothetical protein